MVRKNKTTAASVHKAATIIDPNAASTKGTAEDIVTPADDMPEVLPEGVIRVRAVIRSIYAPFSGIMIPDDGLGVLVERGSWIDVQLKRGLIQEC